MDTKSAVVLIDFLIPINKKKIVQLKKNLIRKNDRKKKNIPIRKKKMFQLEKKNVAVRNWKNI